LRSLVRFPPCAPDDFVRLVGLFEKNNRPYMMEQASANAAKTLALKMDRDILPSMKELDVDVEWADEHLQSEKLERLNRRLRKLRIMNRPR